MKSQTLFVSLLLLILCGCAAEEPAEPAEPEVEMLSRTEFTDRIENFFEYAPFEAGKPSQFLIHVTDLMDGSPVESADVRLIARPSGSSQTAAETKAQVGRVTGIYVAELAIPNPGNFDIEFQIKNPKLDERMLLSDFRVE